MGPDRRWMGAGEQTGGAIQQARVLIRLQFQVQEAEIVVTTTQAPYPEGEGVQTGSQAIQAIDENRQVFLGSP